MKDNDVYVNPCFLMLVGSKTDSSNDNPWEWWMVLTIVNWIGN
jgi:hypothetical protein